MTTLDELQPLFARVDKCIANPRLRVSTNDAKTMRDALEAAARENERLAGALDAAARENIALRCIAGGGCVANDDGPHMQIVTRGKERFCVDCGDMVNSKNCSKPWFDGERLNRAVGRIARNALSGGHHE